MKNLLYWFVWKIDRISRLEYPCMVCRDTVSLYSKLFWKQICVPCSMHLRERLSQPKEPCAECGVPRIGIEMTFKKDYTERCFPCFYTSEKQRRAFVAVGINIPARFKEVEEIYYDFVKEDF